jgi:hypothetical protein
MGTCTGIGSSFFFSRTGRFIMNEARGAGFGFFATTAVGDGIAGSSILFVSAVFVWSESVASVVGEVIDDGDVIDVSGDVGDVSGEVVSSVVGDAIPSFTGGVEGVLGSAVGLAVSSVPFSWMSFLPEFFTNFLKKPDMMTRFLVCNCRV